MGACGSITKGAEYNCTNPINAGTENRLVLFDKDVFDRGTIVFGTPTTLVSSIVLAMGDQGFEFLDLVCAK